MRAVLKSTLTVFLALWLPLQGAVAFATPLCAEMQNPGPVSAAGTESGHHHSHAFAGDTALVTPAAHDHHEQDATTAGDGVDDFAICTDCGLCHFACIQVLTGARHGIALPVMASPVIAPSPRYPSRVPPFPQRPPLA